MMSHCGMDTAPKQMQTTRKNGKKRAQGPIISMQVA